MLSANQILKKEVNDEVYFWYADKHRSLPRVDIMILGVCIKHAQSTQNKKFAYLCNISRKAWDEVGFLRADKHECFLQVHGVTLGVCSKMCPKYPKQVYNIFVIP